jgi:hypothetical protein
LQPNSAASIAAIKARRIEISILMTQQSGRRANAAPAGRPAAIADPIVRRLLDATNFVAELLRSD